MIRVRIRDNSSWMERRDMLVTGYPFEEHIASIYERLLSERSTARSYPSASLISLIYPHVYGRREDSLIELIHEETHRYRASSPPPKTLLIGASIRGSFIDREPLEASYPLVVLSRRGDIAKDLSIYGCSLSEGGSIAMAIPMLLSLGSMRAIALSMKFFGEASFVFIPRANLLFLLLRKARRGLINLAMVLQERSPFIRVDLAQPIFRAWKEAIERGPLPRYRNISRYWELYGEDEKVIEIARKYGHFSRLYHERKIFEHIIDLAYKR